MTCHWSRNFPLRWCVKFCVQMNCGVHQSSADICLFVMYLMCFSHPHEAMGMMSLFVSFVFCLEKIFFFFSHISLILVSTSSYLPLYICTCPCPSTSSYLSIHGHVLLPLPLPIYFNTYVHIHLPLYMYVYTSTFTPFSIYPHPVVNRTDSEREEKR